MKIYFSKAAFFLRKKRQNKILTEVLNFFDIIPDLILHKTKKHDFISFTKTERTPKVVSSAYQPI